MAKPYIDKLTLTDAWQKLSATTFQASEVTLTVNPSNNCGALFRRTGQTTEVPWGIGEYHTFRNIDLIDIEVKQAIATRTGNIITLNGY